jgi:hypothetical protein
MAPKVAGKPSRTIRLRGRNRDVFLQVLLAPPPPSPSLISALKRYRAIVNSGKRKPLA